MSSDKTPVVLGLAPVNGSKYSKMKLMGADLNALL